MRVWHEILLALALLVVGTGLNYWIIRRIVKHEVKREVEAHEQRVIQYTQSFMRLREAIDQLQTSILELLGKQKKESTS